MEPVKKLLAKMRTNYGDSGTSGAMVGGAFDPIYNYSMELGAGFIIFGLFSGFFGKKMIRAVSFLLGFTLGAALGLVALIWKAKHHPAQLPMAKQLAILGVGGVALGALTATFFKYFIFALVGCLAALINVFVAWELKVQGIIQYPLAIGTFVFGSFLASLIPSFSIILVTSSLGSYFLTIGIDCILKSGFNHIFAFGFGYPWSSVGANTSDEVFGLMVFWITLFLWMGVKQMIARDPERVKAKKFANDVLDA